MAVFVRHEPCPKCGSKDNLARYDDGSAYCFGCDYVERTSGQPQKTTKEKKTVSGKLFYSGEFVDFPSRRINKDLCKTFGVRVDGKNNIYFPLYNEDGDIVATEVRLAGKKDNTRWTGNKNNSMLFGMNLFGTGGKYLTIVEGKFDAMAAYEMMGSKWPVISVNSSTSAVEDILSNIDYIESFEKVKICFDNDEPGRKAAQKVAEKLSPGKAEVVTLTKYKDANDYLKAQKASAFNDAWWNSKTFTPAGIKSFADVFSSFRDRVKTEIIPLPDFFGHTRYMFNGGLARGEITTIVGDTSIGKTTLVNNILRGMLQNEDTIILYLGLETTLGELVGKMLSMELGENIESAEDLSDEVLDKLEAKFDDISWIHRLKVVDHRGSIDPDELLQKLRNAIVAFNCNVVFIDPLQQALPNSENDTVRVFMDSLLKLASQTRAAFIVTSHVRKRDTKDPHDITEDDALGSSAIKQVSYNLILASRNKLSDNEAEKNSIKLVVAKNRRVGRTGFGSWLYYEPDTLRLVEGEDPEGFDTKEFS